jgi:acetyl esterase
MSTSEYFKFDPDWESYASKNGFPIPLNEQPPPDPITPVEMNFAAARAFQAKKDAKWDADNPLEDVGFRSQLLSVAVRDGAHVSVKISCPDEARLKAAGNGDAPLPVLFVTHGGGWVSGSHISEETSVLRPLYKDFNIIVVSVEYRLAPEHKFPVWIDDSWDVLEKLLSNPTPFVSSLGVACNLQKLVLVGSSSGAAITATLSHECRDKGVRIAGVVLINPVLCDYRHFPSEGKISESYLQCTQTFLGSCQMATLWNTVLPSAISGNSPRASPLLGETRDLPPHLIFVAGRDSLRDEGIAYARKLESASVPVELSIYQGVPHGFYMYAELKCSSRFREDLKTGIREWVPSI